MSTPLEIIVTGNVSGAASSLKTVQAELGRTALAAQKTDSALGKFATSSNTAGFALQNVGRIAQDLPFGFVGIQNNLNPLLESFQRLKAETGSAGGALKALAGSLVGAGGIGLALSVASSAILIFQNGLQSFSRKSKDTMDEVARANEKAAESYQALITSVAKEASSIAVIVEQLKNEKLSRQERAGLIEDLQQKAPAYFGTLNTEKATIEQITAAYNLYAAAILKSVQAKAKTSTLEEITKRIIALQIKGAQTTDDQVDASGKLVRSNVARMESEEDVSEELKKTTSAYEKYQKTVQGTVGLSLKENRELNQLLVTQAQLTAQIAKALPVDPNLDKEKKAAKGKDPFDAVLKQLEDAFKLRQAFRVKELNADLQNAEKNGAAVSEILLADEAEFLQKKLDLIKKFGKQEGEAQLEIAKNEIEIRKRTLEFIASQVIPNIKAPQTDFGKLATGKIDTKILVQPNEEIIKFGIKWAELNARMKETAEIATSVLSPVFEELFTAITSGSSNAFQTFGNALNQIIKQLVVTLLKAIALGAVLAAITGKPFNIGSILSSSIKGFAGGVNNFEGGLALVGERGPELVSLPRGSNVIPNNQINSSMNGIQVFIPSVVLRGQDMLIQFERARRAAGRNG